ncbi:hypothetical protein GCM10009716_11510 [Streptomyces sodiiphilus]|uniref:DUF559 domain-containing protein n=1 Tax=Streptomyces sodiiphilus TaxID=226217 RepID=A0ABN2NWL6_9ACTN
MQQRSGEAALTAAARAQCDVLTPAQLRAHGVAESTARHRCRPGGPWQRPLPRTVVLHSGPLSWEQRCWAAVLYGEVRGRAALTGRTALALHRLTAVPAPENLRRVNILVPRAAKTQTRRAGWSGGEVVVHRTRRMPPRVRMNAGLPVAPLARAVADAVSGGEPGGGPGPEAAVYEAVQARGVAPAAIAAELREGRRAAPGWLREALADLGAGVRSPAESRARRALTAAGLPLALWNVRLHLDGQWLADPDAYWPRAGVLLEVDSVAHHTSQDGWERTMARHNRIEAVGLKVLHASPRQLRTDPGAVVAAVRQALAGGPYGPWARVTVRPPR